MMGYETFYPPKMDEYSQYMDPPPHPQHWAPYPMPPPGYDPMFQHMMAPQQMMSQPQQPKRDPLIYNPPPVSPPPQRERFSYTRYQLELLNKIYDDIRYPNSMQKQLIAKRVGITREQVKIWFQNRRRKDVTGKGKDIDRSGPQMVPDAIMQGVMAELKSYKCQARGKKTEDKTDGSVGAKKRKREVDDYDEESSKRVCQSGAEENSNCSVDSVFKDNQARTVRQDSFNSITPSPCSEISDNGKSASDVSSDPVYPVSIIPASEVLDMMNPPNVITPDAPLDTLLDNRPPSAESPADPGQIQNPCGDPDSENRDFNTQSLDKEAINESVDRGTPPPNKVAPPSEPLCLPKSLPTSLPENLSYNNTQSVESKHHPLTVPTSNNYFTSVPELPDHFTQPLVSIDNYQGAACSNETNSPPEISATDLSTHQQQSTDPEPSSCAKSGSGSSTDIGSSLQHAMFPPNMFANWFPTPGTPNCQQKENSGFPGMFPFPMIPAEPSMMMPPASMYRDHYPPFMIGAFNNPYFDHGVCPQQKGAAM